MPIYVMECTACDWQDETIVRSWKPETWEPCEECGAAIRKSDTVENLMISDYSNYWAAGRQYVEGGETFFSTSERAAYEDKHQITDVVSPGSVKHREIRDEARWQADTAAQDQGFKNHGEYRKGKKREKQLRKGQLSSGETKVVV